MSAQHTHTHTQRSLVALFANRRHICFPKPIEKKKKKYKKQKKKK